MLAEKTNQTSWAKEIIAILRKNYSSNVSVYSDFYDLPSHIMTEINNQAKANKTRVFNHKIGLLTFEEAHKYVENNNQPLTILTLEILGIDFLGNHFGQNAIYDVLKKVIEIVLQNANQETKCYQQEDGKLVFLIPSIKNNNMQVNKIVSAINSTMVFTHNHLFTIKSRFDAFYSSNSQEAKKYLNI